MSRLGNYLRDTAAEMKHVKWPTQTQTLVYTGLVVLVSVIAALFLSLFDYGFSQLLNSLIR